MIYLALDPSSTHVGYVLADDDQYVHGFQRAYKGELVDRLAQIRSDVDFIIDRFKAEIVAVELPVYVSRGRRGGGATSFGVLREVTGTLRLLARNKGARFVEVMPTEGKSALTGDGKADKQKMIRCARMEHGRIRGEHHADAVGVWLAAYNKVRMENLG